MFNLIDVMLHLDTDSSLHKVWVHIFTSPDIYLFHNPTMLNPESQMSKQNQIMPNDVIDEQDDVEQDDDELE